MAEEPSKEQLEPEPGHIQPLDSSGGLMGVLYPLSSDHLAQLWEIDSNTREEMLQAVQMLNLHGVTGQTEAQINQEENSRILAGLLGLSTETENKKKPEKAAKPEKARKTTRYKILRDSHKLSSSPFLKRDN